jgi:hypothetical protein
MPARLRSGTASHAPIVRRHRGGAGRIGRLAERAKRRFVRAEAQRRGGVSASTPVLPRRREPRSPENDRTLLCLTLGSRVRGNTGDLPGARRIRRTRTGSRKDAKTLRCCAHRGRGPFLQAIAKTGPRSPTRYISAPPREQSSTPNQHPSRWQGHRLRRRQRGSIGFLLRSVTTDWFRDDGGSLVGTGRT